MGDYEDDGDNGTILSMMVEDEYYTEPTVEQQQHEEVQQGFTQEHMKQQEAIRIVYANNDLLYVSIHSLHKITKYVGKDGTPPNINKLGSAQWQTAKQKTKSKI